MYSGVAFGAIGVRARDLDHQLALAGRFGFRGLNFDMTPLADAIERDGAGTVRARFTAAGVIPAGWGLPNGWNGTEAEWQDVLAGLPRLAEAASAIGADRVTTWIWSGSNTFEFDDNVAFHLARLQPIAEILAAHEIRLGLEFLGPKTLRDSFTFPFITSSSDMLELCRAVGPNAGLLLDCWHWYTSAGTAADLQRLNNDDIVLVHVNDAPSGVAIDAQVDNVRGLPGSTGVIDIATFLTILDSIGYDGPVIAEPMQSGLDLLDSDDARLRAVRSSLTTIFETAGVTERAD